MKRGARDLIPPAGPPACDSAPNRAAGTGAILVFRPVPGGFGDEPLRENNPFCHRGEPGLPPSCRECGRRIASAGRAKCPLHKVFC